MTQTAGGGAWPSPANPLLHRPFRRLWLARSLSEAGSRVAAVALIVFVTTETGSARSVGLVLAAYAGPLVLLLLVGGVWADRLRRQGVVAATDLVRCCLHAAAGGLILLDHASVPALAAIGACFGATEAFARPALSGLTPQTVPGPLLQRANAMLAMSSNTAEFAGPLVAVVVTQTIGAGWAFMIDAGTFAASAALMASISTPRRAERAPRSSLTTELVAGLAVIRARPWVWIVLGASGGVLLAGFAPWMVGGAAVAEEQYGSAATFGVLAGAVGLGAVAGAASGLRWRPRSPLVAAMSGLSSWPLFLLSVAVGAPLALVVPLAAAAGLAISLANIWWETTLAECVPPASLSRVAAWDWMASLGLLPLGYLAAGPVTAALGPTTLLLGGAGACAVLIAAAVVPPPARAALASARARPEPTPARVPALGRELLERPAGVRQQPLPRIAVGVDQQ